MKKFAVIGYPLIHSMSPQLHAMLAGEAVEYQKIETPPQKLKETIAKLKEEFDGFNVTIPYKSEVMAYLDAIDPAARRLGAVNTVVNRAGRLEGYNTDHAGFKRSIDAFYSVKGKEVLLLGCGGAARAAAQALKDLGGRVSVLARDFAKGEAFAREYEIQTADPALKSDFRLVVNTTPVGMFPRVDETPLSSLPANLEAVCDIIYNPLETKLLTLAKARGVKTLNGMNMFVGQAVEAQKLWGIGGAKKESEAREALSYLTIGENLNSCGRGVALCGFMGAGKSTEGRILAKKLGLPFYDSDEAVEAKYGKISALFEKGETYFREKETEVIKSLPAAAVVALGGGAILRPQNLSEIRKKYDLIFLDTPFAVIEKRLMRDTTRPLAKDKDNLFSLFQKRYPLYKEAADMTLENITLSALSKLEFSRLAAGEKGI